MKFILERNQVLNIEFMFNTELDKLKFMRTMAKLIKENKNLSDKFMGCRLANEKSLNCFILHFKTNTPHSKWNKFSDVGFSLTFL